MKAFVFAIVTAATLASGSVFGQSVKALDVRSSRGQREMNRLMYGDVNNPRQPETAEQAAAAAAQGHINAVKKSARDEYAAWAGKVARADKITQSNAKRQAVKIAKVEKITGDDADTFVAEFARQAPVAK